MTRDRLDIKVVFNFDGYHHKYRTMSESDGLSCSVACAAYLLGYDGCFFQESKGVREAASRLALEAEMPEFVGRYLKEVDRFCLQYARYIYGQEADLVNEEDCNFNKVDGCLPYDIVRYIDENGKIFRFTRSDFPFIIEKRINPYNRQALPSGLLSEISRRLLVSSFYRFPLHCSHEEMLTASRDRGQNEECEGDQQSLIVLQGGASLARRSSTVVEPVTVERTEIDDPERVTDSIASTDVTVEGDSSEQSRYRWRPRSTEPSYGSGSRTPARDLVASDTDRLGTARMEIPFRSSQNIIPPMSTDPVQTVVTREGDRVALRNDDGTLTLYPSVDLHRELDSDCTVTRMSASFTFSHSSRLVPPLSSCSLYAEEDGSRIYRRVLTCRMLLTSPAGENERVEYRANVGNLELNLARGTSLALLFERTDDVDNGYSCGRGLAKGRLTIETSRNWRQISEPSHLGQVSDSRIRVSHQHEITR